MNDKVYVAIKTPKGKKGKFNLNGFDFEAKSNKYSYCLVYPKQLQYVKMILGAVPKDLPKPRAAKVETPVQEGTNA